MFSVNYHSKHYQGALPFRVGCADQRNSPQGKPYPVLHIGDVTIFPTHAQLRAIGEAIEAYFVGAFRAPGDAIVCDYCGEPATPKPGQSTADTVLCQDCTGKANATQAMKP